MFVEFFSRLGFLCTGKIEIKAWEVSVYDLQSMYGHTFICRLVIRFLYIRGLTVRVDMAQ